MAAQVSSPTGPGTRRTEAATTSFILENLHCPTCVSAIKRALTESWSPDLVRWVSPNIVTSVVTVEHLLDLTVDDMAIALENSGFEICGITSTAPMDHLTTSGTARGLVQQHDPHVNRWVRVWETLRYPADHRSPAKDDSWRAHVENCEQCRSSPQGLRNEKGSTGPGKKEIGELPALSRSQQPWDIMSTKHLAKVDTTTQDQNSGWRVAIAVGGMTCAACSNSITEALNKQSWISKAVVNLVSNSVTAEIYEKEKADKVAGEIEDLGFEATVESVTKIETETEQTLERTVDILIDGLYCQKCPDRVTASLAGFRRQLTIDNLPTRQRPILKITYVPEAPNFTVRRILEAIEAGDSSLHASIYHAPSIEQRSKEIRARHQKQLLVRVIFTLLVAIPTLIIGIVYMNFVSEGNPGRQYLMEPWASGVSRAQIALFIMATPVYFFAASVFHNKALREIWVMWRPGSQVPILRRLHRFGSMNTLMSLGTTIAYVSSVCQMIAAAAEHANKVRDSNFYFDSVVFLTFFLLLGRLIESYSKSKTGDAVDMLGKLRPTTAMLVDNYGTEKEIDTTIPADTLEFGDHVRIPAGSSPPCDGTIISGSSAFDESSLTGESRLVKKQVGDRVYAGTINKNNPLIVEVTGVSGTSMLDRIVEIVREGQTKRAPMEQIADLLVTHFVPVITLVAIITWIVWLSLGFSGAVPSRYLDVSSGGWVAFSLQFAIAVFVVACPCGLALAAPTAIFVGGGLAAKHGILAKGGGEAFQKASQVDVVVFDKTGTLTEGGALTITDCQGYVEGDEKTNELLAALKAVEENSSHPIAKAIVSFCEDKGASGNMVVENLTEIAGKGMHALCTPASRKPLELVVGNEALMRDLGVEVPLETMTTLETWKHEAKSVALIATRSASRSINTFQSTVGDRESKFSTASTTPESSGSFTLSLALAIADRIRPSAGPTINALKASGIRVFMLSGDNILTARSVAARVGIDPDNVIAEVLPTDKAEQIKRLQATLHPLVGRGKDENLSRRANVLMVGDGINDSPALATADVGVAIGSGADVAISSAAFVLVNSDIRSVATLLRLSKKVFQRIKLNFGWALVYNLIMVPFAAGCFYSIKVRGSTGLGGDGSNEVNHLVLDPVWASLAMALSSISVVCSSLLLRTNWWGVGFRERTISVSG